MDPDKQLLEAWKNGVALGHAWWAFADERNRVRFRELQRDGFHLGLQRSLEIELIAHVYDGELKAFGIEYGSNVGPVAIPEYYFSKTAEVDWDAETVTSLGKKFEQVTIEGKREAIVGTVSAPEVVDPRLIEVELAAISEPMDDQQRVSEQGLIQEEPNPPPERETAAKAPEKPVGGKGEFSQPKARGRPSKGPEIEQAIDILLQRGVDLAAMPRPRAYKEVRKCAAAELNSNTKIGFADPVIQRVLLRRFGPRR